MIHRWRKEFQTNAANAFHDKRDPKQKAGSQGYEPGEAPDDLKKSIGELTVENEILKKASGLMRKERRHKKENWRTSGVGLTAPTRKAR
jgi:transposase-like protein